MTSAHRLLPVRAPALVLALAALWPALATAQTTPATPEPVIVPPVERRPVKVPRLPSKDIVLGLFAGTYGTQNFGSSAVAGLRLGYHITEDVFVEGALAQTKVSDENYRQVLPGGVFADRKETLSYVNLSAGYNLLPGEVFIGAGQAKVSALYLIGGIGSTRFNQQRKQTINVGMGLRVFLTERVALQVDMRDHLFSLDLLGKRQSTQNLEWTGGVTVFF
ncbi:MAG: outer membrane beta-barrel domain-containing protein [Burkholderiales bacterium]|nr:outer membrane beta-barrel domain-containing protein [Burkholderiales bacterium]